MFKGQPYKEYLYNSDDLFIKYKVTHQLSFDTLFASILSRVTEVGSIEGEGYKTYFFQVFGLSCTKYLFFGMIFSHFFIARFDEMLSFCFPLS